jgi:hypothetical protein
MFTAIVTQYAYIQTVQLADEQAIGQSVLGIQVQQELQQ